MTLVKFSIPALAFLLCMNFTSASYAQTAFAQSAFGDPSEQVTDTGGGLAAVSDEIDAGAVPVGSTAQVIARFKNEGASPIEFKEITLYPSSTISAAISLNECIKEPLTSGAECAVILSVKGLQPGSWRTEILVRHTGRSRLTTARINGTVDKGDATVNVATDIEVSPTPVDFGTLTASRPIIKSVTLRNITANPIKISKMFIDSPAQSGYDLRTDCETLVSGQACVASILWSPVIAGPSSGFLVIEHDGISAVANIPLTGEFTPGEAQQATIFPNTLPGRGVLVSSETEVDFGTGVNSQSAITISLVNTGDADLKINNINLAGSENGLKIIKNGCKDGVVLTPTEACPLTINWAPTKTGAVIDDVRITHDGARGVLVLPVRGTAEGAISLDSAPIVVTRESSASANEGAPTAEASSPSDGSGSTGGLTSNPGQPVLNGYVITSHSKEHAIIKGPIGSRIVADGTKTLIGGYEWNVLIVPQGVQLTSGANTVILVFDNSLSNVGNTNNTSAVTPSGTISGASTSSSSSDAVSSSSTQSSGN